MSALRRFLSRLLVTMLVLAVVAGGLLTFFALSWRSPAAAEVEIVPGSSVRAIAAELFRHEVISTPRLFELFARARRMNRTMRAGTYEFPAGMTLRQVLEKIGRGEVKQYPFTVVEGWNLREIAAALGGRPFLADAGVPGQVLSLARDPAFVAQLGFSGLPSLEGVLFPDTYLFVKPLSAEAFLKRLTARFREVWNSLDPNEIAATRMTQAQIVTLASVVEKETGVAAERPLIAGVFFNRLRTGMPLQSDPTIIYGLPNYDGNIRKSDISNPHPYNTYVHGGLPPGPICMPGKAAIEAVLRPANTDALYFVARGDGTHLFSSNLSDHLQAVMRYQIAPSRR